MAYIPNNRAIKLEGFSEFEAQLKELAQGYRADLVARNTLVKAAKKSMETVLISAQSEAPIGDKPRDERNPIHMVDTLRLDARIPTERDKKSYYVNETDAAIAVVSVKKSAVSLAQEFGTKKIAGHPFLRPALDNNVNQVLAALKDELATIIPEYARKLAKRKK
jgi:HK97 gp10 family phage protein